MIMAKNRINKVYTKFGDAGNTMLVSGEIVSKDSIRVESYGDIDELNSFIGLALTDKISARGKRILNKIQNDLFILGADLASTKDIKVPRITKTKISWIEKEIDKLVDIVGPLKNLFYPLDVLLGLVFIYQELFVEERKEKWLLYQKMNGLILKLKFM